MEIRGTNSNVGIQLLQHHPTKITKGGWRAAIFITCVEFAERFTFVGLSANLMSYLTNVLHEPIAEAAKNVNTWVGVSSLFPLLGGFIADSYLGRFRTIILSSIIYLLGMVFLTLSVSVIKHTTLFFIALYVLSVGDGGHKPCVQTFAADQFGEDTEEQRNSKSSFFNWWYLAIVLASTTSVFVVVYLQDNFGWTLGLGLVAGVWTIALVLFLLGIKRYKKESPRGSPFTNIAQVFVAALRKWQVKDTPSHENYWYGHDHGVGVSLRSRDQPEFPTEFPTLDHTEQFSGSGR